MARPFRASRGSVHVSLPESDRLVVARLLSDVEALLSEPEPPTATPAAGDDENGLWSGFEAAVAVRTPSDPAVARLLPDGNREDPALSESYRRLTEDGLRQRKRSALSLAASALSRPAPLALSQEEARALVKGLTDVRLVLADRLGLHADEDAEMLHRVLAAATDLDDPWLRAAALYDALTYWQESLLGVLKPARTR
jgi:hypothetical protein